MTALLKNPEPAVVRREKAPSGLFDPKMLLTSLPDALRKLDPRVMVKNPVMFVVEVGAVASTILAFTDSTVFVWSIVVWLWLTVLFANLAEAVAEGVSFLLQEYGQLEVLLGHRLLKLGLYVRQLRLHGRGQYLGATAADVSERPPGGA